MEDTVLRHDPIAAVEKKKNSQYIIQKDERSKGQVFWGKGGHSEEGEALSSPRGSVLGRGGGGRKAKGPPRGEKPRRRRAEDEGIDG